MATVVGTRTTGSTSTTLLSWVIVALVAWQMYMSTKVGTTPRGTPAREALQHFHLSMGLTIVALTIVRLWLWGRESPPPRPAGMPASAFALGRTYTLLMYCTVIAFGLTGPVQAWANGHEIHYWSLFTVPRLVAESYQTSVTFGYLHSAIAFWFLYMIAFGVLLALYQTLRYRAPIHRLLPGWR